MPPGFTVKVLKDCRSASYVQMGFLVCFATQQETPYQTRRFVYCLHCSKLRSHSWFDSHKTKVTFDLSEETLAKHVFMFPQYVQDITTEMEMMNDAGKLFKKADGEMVIDPRLDSSETPQQPCFRPLEQFDDSDDSDTDDGGDLDHADCDEEDFCFKRLLQSLTDCFDKFCFLHGKFDSSKFIFLTQTFFDEKGYDNLAWEHDRFTLLKAKTISFVMKKVFVMLALTKSQMDTLNAFFKTVLFVAGEDRTLSKHIHAGYLSCVRECERRVEKRS